MLSVIKQKRGFVDVWEDMMIMMTVLIIKVSVIKQKRGFVDVWEAKPCKRGPHITLSSVYLCSSNYYQKIRRKGSLLIWSYIALGFLEWKISYLSCMVLWFDENTSQILKKVVKVLCFDNITFQV